MGKDTLKTLREAAWLGDLEAVEALLASGASVRARDDRGRKLLEQALEVGNQRLADLLFPPCMAVLGDVHGEDRLLERALKFIEEQGVPVVVCTGDILDDDKSNAGRVDRCCELLSDAQVHVISGNHDRWYLNGEGRSRPGATQDWELGEVGQKYLAALSSLPSIRAYETPAGVMLLCHDLCEIDGSGEGEGIPLKPS